MKIQNIMIIAILALITVVACTTPGTNPGTITQGTDLGTTLSQGTYNSETLFEPTNDVESSTFGSEEDLMDFLKNHENSYNSYALDYYGGGMMRDSIMVESMNIAVDGAAPTAIKMADESDSGSIDYSETNNQVEGVDEADIIKTDGNYIYTITGKTLYIIKAYPGEDAEVVSRIKFENNPSSLFVDGDNLAVFGNFYNTDYFDEIGYTPRSGMTFFNVYDISDKENPELTEEYKFEGNYFQGRMSGDYVYIVTTTSQDTFHPMPFVIKGEEMTYIGADRIYYYNIPYDNPQFANIHSINLKNPDSVESKSVIVEGSQTMYMSQNNMYITYTEYINEWELQREIVRELVEPLLPSSDKTTIEKIKNTDNDVLSQNEKESKIFQIIERYTSYMGEKEQEELQTKAEEMLKEKLDEYEYMEYTIIHKISVDNGNINIEKTGKIGGHVVNQFSLDEYQDVLRVATTVSARWSYYDDERTKSTNHVFTLNKNMEIMDQLSGLAEGESIYSTRFMGDKLYMVTFRQVDPFFVIDLSNPNKIKQLGELKIPGFSRYLHPYDENTIIGIGRDATDTGRQQGLKISLFDVSDVENPKEIAKFVAEGKYSSSVAEYEHKAFLFSKEKNLLVIPAYSYDYQNGESYNGAMVFDISKTGIELRGIIDHSNGGYGQYGSAVERSLYIEDLLYTKSPNLLRINSLENLESVKNIELKDSNSPYKVY